MKKKNIWLLLNSSILIPFAFASSCAQNEKPKLEEVLPPINVEPTPPKTNPKKEDPKEPMEGEGKQSGINGQEQPKKDSEINANPKDVNQPEADDKKTDKIDDNIKNDESKEETQPEVNTPKHNLNNMLPLDKYREDKTIDKGYVLKDEDTLRIMHWNILNYGGDKSTPDSAKVFNIATGILKSQADIIGLTEINYGRTQEVQYIMNEIKKIDPNSNYKIIVQDDQDAKNTKFQNSIEQIVIIYNANVVEPKLFNNGVASLSFMENINNIDATGNFNGTTQYVRPLFGTYFNIYGWNKNITTVFGHFDSPGAKVSNGETKPKKLLNEYVISQQGSQEVAEFVGLKQVYEYFKNLTNNDNFIFGGDTNIRLKSSALIDYLSDTLQSYYKSDDNSRDIITSLRTTVSYNNNPEPDGYSEAYDKWLFYENNLNIIDKSENPQGIFKIDILQGFSTKLFDYDETVKRFLNVYPNDEIDDFDMIRKGLSDHAPIIIDIKNN